MSHRPFKDRLYAEFATIGKALASAHRLELLDLLGQGERSVDELAHEIGQSLANTSAHLQVLRQARLVEADKRGWAAFKRLELEGGMVLENIKGRIDDPYQLEGMNKSGLAGIELRFGHVGLNVQYKYLSSTVEDPSGAKVKAGGKGAIGGLSIIF